MKRIKPGLVLFLIADFALCAGIVLAALQR